MLLQKAVRRAQLQRWIHGSWSGLWGWSSLLGACWLGGLGVPQAVEARPRGVGRAPARMVSSRGVSSTPVPVAAPPQVEPGAAELLDAQPLQVGLMDHGWPERIQAVPSPPKPVPTGTPPAPAGAPALKTPSPPSRQLVLDRRRKVLRVIDGNRVLRRYPVAVGMPGWETPVGQFTVIEKQANPTWEHPASGHLLPPGPENPLGSRWIGFHRDCRGRSGFNGQQHLVVKGCVEAGFHGTPNRASVGRAVSHGCVRLLDEHAKELFDLVSLGTPVIVLP